MTDISELTKDELKMLALEHGIKLDMRKGVEELRTEVSALNSAEPIEDESVIDLHATHLYNRANGRVFVRTTALENHLKDFYFCDADGKPV